MIFISDSRLIFKVNVRGTDKLVVFSEPGVGRSTFESNDRDVVDAIRRHKFHRQGKIREMGAEPEPTVEASVATEQPETSTDTSQELLEFGSYSQELLEFGSYSQLKQYLRKQFGIDANQLKTPPQVKKVAREKGLNYRFTEQ